MDILSRTNRSENCIDYISTICEWRCLWIWIESIRKISIFEII